MLPNLKLLRKEKGVSQQKLADAIGVSQQSINQYENHSVEPDIGVLCAIADYFDTSIDFVVGRTAQRYALLPTDTGDLNEAESSMLRQFRNLTRENRQVFQTVLDALSSRKE